MKRCSLKTLHVAFLILFIGSTNSMDADMARRKTAASRDFLPNAVVRRLSRDIEYEESVFSKKLLDLGSRTQVDALSMEFKEFEPGKQQSTLKAIIVTAIGALENGSNIEAEVLWKTARLAAEVLWKTARLADFLLGNCAATHVWLDKNVQRFTLLRKPEVAQSVLDGMAHPLVLDRMAYPFLVPLAKGFMAGAKAFGQTYCNFYDFILAQEAIDAYKLPGKFDADRVFGDTKCMPTVVDIFNWAVAQNWTPVQMEHAVGAEAGAVKKKGGRDEDCNSATGHSATGSTSSIGGPIKAGVVLRTLRERIPAEIATGFAASLFAEPTSVATLSLHEILVKYNELDDARRSDVLKAVVVKALEFLDGVDADRNHQAWWVTARLAGFLLGNRLLPPLHGWLDGVDGGIDDDTPADDDTPPNVSALVYLMTPRTGMLHTAMISLMAGKDPPQEGAFGSTIIELSKMFKDIAVSFDGAYREIDTMSRTQFHRDKARLTTRIMPSSLEVFNRAAQIALAIRRVAAEKARDADYRSPLKSQARLALTAVLSGPTVDCLTPLQSSDSLSDPHNPDVNVSMHYITDAAVLPLPFSPDNASRYVVTGVANVYGGGVVRAVDSATLLAANHTRPAVRSVHPVDSPTLLAATHTRSAGRSGRPVDSLTPLLSHDSLSESHNPDVDVSINGNTTQPVLPWWRRLLCCCPN